MKRLSVWSSLHFMFCQGIGAHGRGNARLCISTVGLCVPLRIQFHHLLVVATRDTCSHTHKQAHTHMRTRACMTDAKDVHHQ